MYKGRYYVVKEMKVFLYERVSSEEQARHGYSLDAQQRKRIKRRDILFIEV